MSQVITIHANIIGAASSGIVALTIGGTVAGAVGVAALVVLVIETHARNASTIDVAEVGVTVDTLVVSGAGTGHARRVARHTIVVSVVGHSIQGFTRRPADVVFEGVVTIAR